jgi:hypothetical protein
MHETPNDRVCWPVSGFDKLPRENRITLCGCTAVASRDRPRRSLRKFDNFKAVVALPHAFYNFVKTNIAIRCTPAMAAGVENSVWTVRDLVATIEA